MEAVSCGVGVEDDGGDGGESLVGCWGNRGVVDVPILRVCDGAWIYYYDEV